MEPSHEERRRLMEQRTCRVCGGTDGKMLHCGCACRSAVAFAHFSCLMRITAYSEPIFAAIVYHSSACVPFTFVVSLSLGHCNGVGEQSKSEGV